MDFIKTLLGILAILLLAAFGVSWRSLTNHVGDSKEDISKQKLDLQALNENRDRLALEVKRLKQGQPLDGSGDTGNVITPSAASADDPFAPATGDDHEPTPEELAAQQARAKAISEALHPGDDVDFGDDNKKRQQQADSGAAEIAAAAARRQALIVAAPVVATLQEWIEDPQLGSLAVLKPATAAPTDALRTGVEVLIRRNGGVLGTLRIDEITPEGISASPLTTFDALKPVPGDELIVAPPKDKILLPSAEPATPAPATPAVKDATPPFPSPPTDESPGFPVTPKPDNGQ